MTNILAITKREFMAYFYSPLAYVIMTAFLFFSGMTFFLIVRGTGDSNSLRYLLQFLGWILAFVSPMITMRLIAEEKKTGTIEILMTAPVTDTQIVLAKFFGTLCFLGLLLLPTILYGVLLERWNANPDWGQILSTYLGLLLLSSAFFSIGILISALSTNQIVAAMVTFVVLVVWYWFIDFLAVERQETLNLYTLLGSVVLLVVECGLILATYLAVFRKQKLGRGWPVKLGFGLLLVAALVALEIFAFQALHWEFFSKAKEVSIPINLGKVFEYISLQKNLDGFAKGVVDSRSVVFYLSIVVACLFLTVRAVESRRWRA